VIRLHLTLKHLDTLDDVLDIIPDLPDEYKRGIDMDIVKSLQEVVYNKMVDQERNKNANKM